MRSAAGARPMRSAAGAMSMRSAAVARPMRPAAGAIRAPSQSNPSLAAYCPGMATPASASIAHQADVAPRDGISFTRLLWVAPLTLVVAVAVNSAIKFTAQRLNPAGFTRMPQLQEPMLILTIEGVLA